MAINISSPNPIRFSDISNEFGLPTGKNLGAYRRNESVVAPVTSRPAAVIVPAVKSPLVPLETIVPEVVPEGVALEVTVNVAAPELLYDVELDNPVPEVLSVNKLLRVPLKIPAVKVLDEGL